MNYEQPAISDNTDTEFDDLIGLNGPEAKAAAEEREAQRKSEVADLLQRNGVTPEAMSTEPVKDWADALREEASFEPAPPKSHLNETATKIADDLVPTFGEALKPYEQSAIAYGFPPAVDALITKTGIDEERAEMVLINFRQAFQLAGAWAQKAQGLVVTDESQTEMIAEAKRLHKIVRDDRINVEKRRKELKERPLREGQLIDGVANVYKDLLEPIETHLLKGAKFVENLEAERKAKLAQERGAKLALFEVDPKTFSNLGDMTDEAFAIVYSGVRQQYQEIQAEAEARLKAEREREIENERLRKENERLESERAAEAARAAEQQRIANEATAKLKAQQEETDRKEAERKAEEERLRLGPDKDKLVDLAQRIIEITHDLPDVDPKFDWLLSEVKSDLGTIVRKIQVQTERLGFVESGLPPTPRIRGHHWFVWVGAGLPVTPRIRGHRSC
jgi:hypothetical protein